MFVWTQDGGRGEWSRSALPTFGDVVWRVSWSVAGNVLAVSSGKLIWLRLRKLVRRGARLTLAL